MLSLHYQLFVSLKDSVPCSHPQRRTPLSQSYPQPPVGDRSLTCVLMLPIVTGQILFTTHTAGFLPLQLYSGGEQRTPQEEVFTASVMRVENFTPKLTGHVYVC